MSIGERLRAARMKHNLRQKDVAEAVGVNQTLVGEWERGEKKIPDKRLRQLSEVLYVKESWLRGGWPGEGSAARRRRQDGAHGIAKILRRVFSFRLCRQQRALRLHRKHRAPQTVPGGRGVHGAHHAGTLERAVQADENRIQRVLPGTKEGKG